MAPQARWDRRAIQLRGPRWLLADDSLMDLNELGGKCLPLSI